MFYKHYFVILFATLLACPLLFSQEGPELPGANSIYYSELTTYLKEEDSIIIEHKPADIYDKIFMEVFTPVKPADSPIIQLTQSRFPRLFSFIRSTCADLGIEVPRIFFSNDTQNVDIKCITYNNKSALLLHHLTLSCKTTRAFRGYLRTTLRTLAFTLSEHTRLLQDLRKWKIASIVGGLGSMAFGGFAFNKIKDKKTWKSPFGLAALTLGSAGVGGWIKHIMSERLTTISYQNVASFDNIEGEREDTFPGLTPDRILIPVYNATPEHAVSLVLDAQEYLNKRNLELQELRKSDEEDLEEDLLD